MGENNKDQLQGTLDLLVLRILSNADAMHGFAIAERIEQISHEVLRVEAGSLYPALHRMTEAGWVKSSWGVSENNRRARFYTITPVGRRRLAAEEKHWSALTSAVGRVLKNA
jgi:transcriptional regulator